MGDVDCTVWPALLGSRILQRACSLCGDGFSIGRVVERLTPYLLQGRPSHSWLDIEDIIGSCIPFKRAEQLKEVSAKLSRPTRKVYEEPVDSHENDLKQVGKQKDNEPEWYPSAIRSA